MVEIQKQKLFQNINPQQSIEKNINTNQSKTLIKEEVNDNLKNSDKIISQIKTSSQQLTEINKENLIFENKDKIQSLKELIDLIVKLMNLYIRLTN